MNANAIKITESTEIKTMTVSELLTAQDIGDIATPDIQRPAGVWNAEQCAKLEDTISRGWGIGTISIVEVSKGEKTLRLLDDGLQRLTALRIQRDAATAACDTAEAAYNAAVDEGTKLDANPAADPIAKAAADAPDGAEGEEPEADGGEAPPPENTAGDETERSDDVSGPLAD